MLQARAGGPASSATSRTFASTNVPCGGCPAFTSFRPSMAQGNSSRRSSFFGALLMNTARPMSNPSPAISVFGASGTITKQAFSGGAECHFLRYGNQHYATNSQSRSTGNRPAKDGETGPGAHSGSASDATELEVPHPSIAPRLRHFCERNRHESQNGILRGSFCIPFCIPFR